MRWSMKKHSKLKPKIPAFTIVDRSLNVSWLPPTKTGERQVCYMVESDKARNESLNMRASRLMGMIAS